MPTLGAPLEPATSASPLVMQTPSTLPSEKASMLGTYSSHSNDTWTPSCSKYRSSMATCQATQPGQSLYAMRSGPGGLGGATLGAAALLGAGLAAGSPWQA